METYSEVIGRFAGGLRLADVPPAVVQKAKLVFLDTLGIALASSGADWREAAAAAASAHAGRLADAVLHSTASPVRTGEIGGS